MNDQVAELIEAVDNILIELTGFSTSDFADFDFASNDGREPEDIAYEILAEEGYPVDTLNFDSAGRLYI